jgi:hypothetical protein
MAVLGCILLILAGLIHSWWGAQAKADLDQKAAGFFFWGLKPLYITILLLAFGEGLIWYGANLGLALAAIFDLLFHFASGYMAAAKVVGVGSCLTRN